MGEEGRAVRAAFDGPIVDHDQLLGFVAARNRDDEEVASIGMLSRAAIKEFLDDTGLNSQALSWGRVIVKKLRQENGEAKALDVLRSLDVILPMIRAHVEGQSTPDMFEAAPITLIEDGP